MVRVIRFKPGPAKQKHRGREQQKSHGADIHKLHWRQGCSFPSAKIRAQNQQQNHIIIVNPQQRSTAAKKGNHWTNSQHLQQGRTTQTRNKEQGQSESSVEYWHSLFRTHSRWRPYRVECRGSLLTSEDKRRGARLVLGRGTAREDLRVLPALLHRNVAPCQFGIRLFHSIFLSLSLSLSLFLALCLHVRNFNPNQP